MFINEELSQDYEVYSQEKYTYAYIRSPGGYGNECNIMTFPINYQASVAVALTFMNTWKAVSPKWLAKDVVVVFFDDSRQDAKKSKAKIGENYSQAINEFLKWYYIGSDGNSQNVQHILNPENRIHGRCGLLR